MRGTTSVEIGSATKKLIPKLVSQLLKKSWLKPRFIHVNTNDIVADINKPIVGANSSLAVCGLIFRISGFTPSTVFLIKLADLSAFRFRPTVHQF